MIRPRRAVASSLLLSLWPGAAALGQVQPRLGIEIPMRDRVNLSADMWLPSRPGKYPVILIRTPYGKTGQLFDVPEWAAYYASRGYVFVVQDTRGRGDSGGRFNFLFPEGTDGFDTIEWLATQPFSSGRVGMMGVSYLGTVQWLAARERPPHLACIVPSAAAGRYLDEAPWRGGAFMEQFALSFVNEVSGRLDQEANELPGYAAHVLAHRPLLTADSVFGRPMRLYREFLTHPSPEYWRPLQFSTEDFAKITIPTLTVTGWYDGDQPGALFYWTGVMSHAPSKDGHFLVVGPWLHPQTFRGGSGKVGKARFTAESVIDAKALHLGFFDWCLKGATRAFNAPRARIYVTGANEWRSYDAYPPQGVSARRLYLTSGGHANSLTGDGKLSWQAPAEQQPDTFTYDPKRPVPAFTGELLWGEDRRPIQRRRDVLVYTSHRLTEPVEVIGSAAVTLEAASDALDTDFTAVLSDIYPDGRAVELGPALGIRRARYRHGYAREELLTPGDVASFEIDLNDMAHRFRRGHRIRLEVSSSAVPLYNPNQNTGHPIATDTVWKVAKQSVYHDRVHASFVSLPVIANVHTP